MAEIEVVLLGVAVVAVSLVVAVGFMMQARRIRQHGRAGVSPTSWIAMISVLPLWFVYGIRMSDPGVVISNALLWLPCALVIITWGRAAERRWASWPALVALTAALISTAAISPIALVGLAAIVLDLGTTWPQAYRAVRAKDLMGVSLGAWTFRASTLVLWFTYGVHLGLPHLALAAASKLIASLVVVVLVVTRRPPGLPLATP